MHSLIVHYTTASAATSATKLRMMDSHMAPRHRAGGFLLFWNATRSPHGGRSQVSRPTMPVAVADASRDEAARPNPKPYRFLLEESRMAWGWWIRLMASSSRIIGNAAAWLRRPLGRTRSSCQRWTIPCVPSWLCPCISLLSTA